MADALHQCGPRTLNQVGDQCVADLPVLRGNLHLDQFVVFEREDDFVDQRIADSLAADLQHRLQAMRLTAKETGLGVGQDDRHAWESERGRAGYHGVPALPADRLSAMFEDASALLDRLLIRLVAAHQKVV